MTDRLVKMILESDLSAIDLAKIEGNSAGESIKGLFTHGDSSVRQLAIYSAHEAGIDGVADDLVPLLADESPSVRRAALVVLRKRIDASIYPNLLQIYPKIPDAEDRSEVALFIAQIPAANIADFIKLRNEDPDSVAREGCSVALAKLGEDESRNGFSENLRSLKGRDLERYLEYVEYIFQPWLLYDLVSILENKETLIFIGSFHAPTPGPDSLRACDIAVNLIAGISNARFSFSTETPGNYSDSQLEEVRNHVNRLS